MTGQGKNEQLDIGDKQLGGLSIPITTFNSARTSFSRMSDFLQPKCASCSKTSSSPRCLPPHLLQQMRHLIGLEHLAE